MGASAEEVSGGNEREMTAKGEEKALSTPAGAGAGAGVGGGG